MEDTMEDRTMIPVDSLRDLDAATSAINRFTMAAVATGGDPRSLSLLVGAQRSEVARALEQIRRLLVALAPDPMQQLLAELACDRYVHHHIISAHFPGANPRVSIEGVRLVNVGGGIHIDEAVERLGELNPPLKASALDKSIRYAAQHPSIQRTRVMLCAGQSWHRPWGGEFGVIFYGHAEGRCVGLFDLNKKLFPGYRIFAELLHPDRRRPDA